MAYKVVTTPSVDKQLEQAVNYILNVFCDEYVAGNLLRAFSKTVNSLKVFPRSHRKCINGKFEGYYKANIGKYKYVILYRIYKNIVVIEELHHMSEDYGSLRQ